jgi:hypothetical protein
MEAVQEDSIAEIRGRDVPGRARTKSSGSRKRNLALVLEDLSGITGGERRIQ